MSQKLGGGFERRSLKLFKRRAGKLFVCRVKPKAIDPGVVFSTRVSNIVELLKGKSGIMLHDLVEAICPSVPGAESAEVDAQADKVPTPPTDEQITVIKDIRWLANEGYVIEYSDGMVFLGVQGEVQPAKAPKSTSQPEAAADTSNESAPAATTETATSEAESAINEAILEAPASEEMPKVEEVSPVIAEDATSETEAKATTEEIA